MSVARELEAGMAAHKAGQWGKAEKHYRRAIKNPALQSDAFHLLGLLDMDRGNPKDALRALAKAVDVAPSVLAYRLTKARCEYQLAAYRAAFLTLTSMPPEASRDARMRQQLADALSAIGLGLREAEGPQAALPAFREACALIPGHPGMALNLGLTLVAAEQAEEAIPILLGAHKAFPRDAELILALSGALLEVDRYGDAEELLRTASTSFPSDARFAGNLATSLNDQGRAEDALIWSERVLALGGDTPLRLFNHANILSALGRFPEAETAYNAALSGGPEDKAVLVNRGMARITVDPSSLSGWSDYLNRHVPFSPEGSARALRPPLKVEPGQKICLLAEQGLGDQLFFLRWAPKLRAMGCDVALLLDGKLKGLLEGTALPWFDTFDVAVEAGYTVPVWLGDLPLLAREEGALVSVPKPFPLARPAGMAFRSDLQAATGCEHVVGLTWRAGVPGRHRLNKEVPLDAFVDILADLPVGVVGLQRNPTSDELSLLTDRLGSRFVDYSAHNNALADMAAVLSALDIYLTVSNTNLHIAESLGDIRSFVIVPRPFFTWGAEGEASPWFPNSRVFRRKGGTEWDSTLRSLSQALRDCL